MFFVLSKLLAAFAVLSNLIGLAAGAGLVALALRRRKQGLGLLITAVVLLLIAGWLPVGSAALRILEDRFPLPEIPGEVAGIVVLGGEIDTDLSTERHTVALSSAGERLTKTAELSLVYPKARILLSGGSANLLSYEAESEAAMARDLLMRIGVPDKRIELEERSRNTCENAVESKAVARPKPGEAWLLVTSAFHMPRSVACFRAAGFPVIPYPVGYQVRRSDVRHLTSSLSMGLYLADLAAHEWVGLVAYHFSMNTELFPIAR
ncbi:YdcF family protein [Mesorhizobium plurifarium]|uniref:YdcF family protein n=1 Tax=Sinorhizobium arboris TaxID=76745 RepID=UPI00040E3503|nr:YdcF family protein [Sinorhizobium arboris]PST27144.1 YdcF family protein [Mesorhizobium plurifarium]